MKRFLCILLVLVLLAATGCDKFEKLTVPDVVTADPLQATPIPEDVAEASAHPGSFDGENADLPENTDDEASTSASSISVIVHLTVKALAVNVREGASTSSKRLASLQGGTNVRAVAKEGDWYKVEYLPNQFGYAMAKYFEEVKVEADASEIYNDSLEIDDNIFLDALEYAGYNMKKHREDGNMWKYVLCRDKAILGYLSGMGSGTGITTGLEKRADGLPDIERIKANGGMSSAAFATYVYFNYLPNVKKIDTSKIPQPKDPNSPVEWRAAAEEWVHKGIARKIEFMAVRNGDGSLYFEAKEQIPVGSVVLYKTYGTSDDNTRSVAIYLGKRNDCNWLMQVEDGEIRGPEMITMEHGTVDEVLAVPIEIITIPDLA